MFNHKPVRNENFIVRELPEAGQKMTVTEKSGLSDSRSRHQASVLHSSDLEFQWAV